ncbi:hypothetical protein GJ496_006449 [Pomphorhynchus laevis]|nr:hypothetical protein GJ496_006449 [Pomphorhynchus laevis]
MFELGLVFVSKKLTCYFHSDNSNIEFLTLIIVPLFPVLSNRKERENFPESIIALILQAIIALALQAIIALALQAIIALALQAIIALDLQAIIALALHAIIALALQAEAIIDSGK